ncbi:MAG TPA: DUF6265 family protein [Dyadobacter sp.]|jgi:hypothetical protein|nr:DUF6265 family protein [Dyadobacter sp.]
MKLAYLLFCLCLSYCGFTQSFKASVNDLGFMTGTWQVKHEWGDMEEFWGAPIGNSMVSSFRCVKDGKPVFYEFVVIEQEEDVPVMKLRHFNPGSIGWEEKDAPLEYPLISLTDKKAVFEARDKKVRLIYSIIAGKMEVVLEEQNKDGIWDKTVFLFCPKEL